MLFNSLQFMFFFPIVTILYFVLPHKFRWFLLLIASCVFYMAFIPVYILILFITILIDYFAGMWIEKANGKQKKMFLVISIISTCLVLFVFKYFNFFNANFEALAQLIHWNYPIPLLYIILPIGLSFHTFQSLSYVIEVYYGRQKAEHNFGIYALYVMFYPQLVAGPIERPQNLLHQFYQEHRFDYQRVTDGLKLMLWGLFKKVVIADRLAVVVNIVYGNPTDYIGLPLIIATYFFAFQIYCDFSGYSDIAIGAAQVMGFRLMDNFNRPYFAKSVPEFWKRWHISLSTWFRDYLYIPLGGNRVSKQRWHFNLFITFLISGLWHGANWTFIVWGALHGFYMILSQSLTSFTDKLKKSFSFAIPSFIGKSIAILITFHLVLFSWIFFRVNSVGDAMYVITHLFQGLTLSTSQFSLGLDKFNLILAVCLIFFLFFVQTLQRHRSIRHMLSEKPLAVRWAFYYILIFGILFLGMFNNSVQFIYFQF